VEEETWLLLHRNSNRSRRTALDYAREAAADTSRIDHAGAVLVAEVLERAMNRARRSSHET
jgi:hypothetical protein